VSRRTADAAAFALVVAFATIGLFGLDAVPRVHEDEPWIAAPGLAFWTTGHFATDLSGGFFGAERHEYGFLPLFPLLVGLALKVLGTGLFEARIVALSCATASLGLTYLAGRRLLSPTHGLSAAVILAAWPVAIPGGHRPTGIPLADLGRIARYDVAVPVFGLLSLLVLLSALDADGRPPRGRLFAAGFLAGLATLTHAYGAAWLAVAGATLLIRRPSRLFPALLLVSGGFLSALAPWVAFVVSGFADFVSQNRTYSGRFDLFSFRFYAANVADEGRRYEPVLRAAQAGRIATWVLLAAILSGLVLLGRRARATAEAVPRRFFSPSRCSRSSSRRRASPTSRRSGRSPRSSVRFPSSRSSMPERAVSSEAPPSSSSRYLSSRGSSPTDVSSERSARRRLIRSWPRGCASGSPARAGFSPCRRGG